MPAEHHPLIPVAVPDDVTVGPLSNIAYADDTGRIWRVVNEADVALRVRHADITSHLVLTATGEVLRFHDHEDLVAYAATPPRPDPAASLQAMTDAFKSLAAPVGGMTQALSATGTSIRNAIDNAIRQVNEPIERARRDQHRRDVVHRIPRRPRPHCDNHGPTGARCMREPGHGGVHMDIPPEQDSFGRQAWG